MRTLEVVVRDSVIEPNNYFMRIAVHSEILFNKGPRGLQLRFLENFVNCGSSMNGKMMSARSRPFVDGVDSGSNSQSFKASLCRICFH